MRVLLLLGLLGLGACANLAQIAADPFQGARPITQYRLPPSGPTAIQTQTPAQPSATPAQRAAILNSLNARPAPQPKPDIHYDTRQAVLGQQLNQLVNGASLCAYRSAKAQLTMGNRNRASILIFSENVCGGALQQFLIAQGRPAKEAQAFIHLLASKELDNILAANP